MKRSTVQAGSPGAATAGGAGQAAARGGLAFDVVYRFGVGAAAACAPRGDRRPAT